MAIIAGIEGKGRVTLLRSQDGGLGYVGSLVLDRAHWRRAQELVESDEPVTYIGPAHTKAGTKNVTLSVRVTTVHAPSMSGVQVDFASTGAPSGARS